MNASPEFGATIRTTSSPKHDFHHQNGPTAHAVDFPAGYGGIGDGGVLQNSHLQQQHQQQQQQQAQQQDLTIDGIPNNFPHRRSRASRTFKNPPQPHMCIKERTLDGKEVFINVLSWTRIANPDNPDAPIPLYGGMKVGKVPPGSPKTPPLVYAVMASPEVLKKAGRKCPDTPERTNLVDLMCEFVEAMNPSLHLSRKPEILKDRDLSGELKDVWSAVQACREKGRSDNGPPENLVVYTEFGPDSAPSYEHTIQQHQQQQYQQQQQQHDQLPNSFEQHPGRFPLSGVTAQQQQQYPYHHHHQQQQSAINHNHNSHNSSVLTSIEPISAISAVDGTGGDAGAGSNGFTTSRPLPSLAASVNGSSHVDEELAKETESLKLSSSNGSSNSSSSSNSSAVGKTNGLTLPTEGATTPSVTSSSSPTVPQTSPTNPAAGGTPPAVKEPTKSSSGHNFFPMFRSSKSSSGTGGANGGTTNNALPNNSSSAGGDKTSVNGGSEPPAAPVPSHDGPAPEPAKAAKSSGKKSGLNFFRRNKSSTDGGGKKEPSTPTKQPPTAGVLPASISSATSGPATPAATGAAATGPEAKLLALSDDAISHGLSHRGHHPYHLEATGNGSGGGSGTGSVGGGGGTGGTGGGGGGEIVESNTATIAAK